VKRSDEASAAPRTAVLVRRQQVDIEDMSRKGCRFDSREARAVGEIGMLTASIDGQMHVELYRVTRSVAAPGTHDRFETGVEFLPMPAGTPSLHDLAARLDDSHSS
jgi:hypothetical protein